MSGITLPTNSILCNTPIYSVDGDIFPGLIRPAVVEDRSDTVYLVTAGGENRLDLISFAQYNTPELWWVIASVNSLVDPLTGIPAGTSIRIPLKSRIEAEGIVG